MAEPEIKDDDEPEVTPKKSSASYIAKLEKDNFTYRRDRANLREELAATKAKLPADGSVVLSGDDAKAWEKYKALGKADDLENASKLSQTDAADLARLRKAEVCEKAGKIAGFPTLSLLGRLISADDLQLEFGEETKDGKAVPTVGVKGADGKVTPLTDYAASHWSESLPALLADSHTPNPVPRNQGTPPRGPQRPAPVPGAGTQQQQGGNIPQLLSLGIYH